MAAPQICLQFVFLLSFSVYSRGQFGGTLPTVKTNPNTNAIPVFVFQGDGYSSEQSWAYYNDSSTFQSDLISYTVCHRLQIYYDRPRMYLFTYASSDEETNELYSEYHLGRKAFRICKRGTKYCSWHRDMPDFYMWRHICVAYDGLKDLYKLFVDGEKVDSGTFAGDNAVEVVRHGGLTYLGQDQDSLGGGFNGRQSWSGTITQFNIWSFALEDYFMENAAECRSDILGDVEEWALDKWVQSDIDVKLKPLFELCGGSDDINEQYFLFPDPFDSNFYTAWCRNMGGGIAVPQSEEGYHEMMDIAESMVNRDAHEKCMHASGSLIVWGGPTDIIEEDLWADPYTKEPLAYKGFWESGQPNGGMAENCIRTYIDRRWQDKDCQEKNCALCHFPIRMNLSIRGLCPSETKLMEGYYDNFYFI